MDGLEPFWRFLEQRPCWIAVLAEWQHQTGDGFELLRPLLRPCDEIASSYPHPADGTPLAIVQHEIDGFVAIDREGDGVRVPLTYEQVVLYELPVDQLACQAARVLGLRTEYEPLAQRRHVLGWWTAQPGSKFPVLLWLPRSTPDFETHAQLWLSPEQPPSIILTLTRTTWSAAVCDVFRTRKHLPIPLSEVIQAESGVWKAGEAWAGYQQSFRRLAMPDSPAPSLPAFAFGRKGQMWVVRYQGDETYLKDAVGHWYVAHLLAHPCQRIYAPDLQAAVTGQNPLVHAGSAGEMSDRKTLDDIAAEYAELQDDLEEANQNHDEGAQIALRQKMDQLAEYVRQVQGFGDRIRIAADGVEHARKAITQAIERTLAGLKRHLPAAARHLDISIRRGRHFCYDPDLAPPWDLSS